MTEIYLLAIVISVKKRIRVKKQATRKNDFIFRYPIAVPHRNESGKETRFEYTSELPVEKSNDHSPLVVLSFMLAFFLLPNSARIHI